MPHDEPLNERAGHPVVPANIRVFDWTEFDGEPPVQSNHEANDMQDEGFVTYDRADEEIDEEDETNDFDGEGDGDPSINDDDDNDDGGEDDGVVSIPIELVHAVSDAVQQPSETGIVGNDGFETREVGQEDDVPISQLFPTTLPQSTPSVGAVLARLQRSPLTPSNAPPQQDAMATVNRTLNSRGHV